jgi:pimeloyl-ACP methyl ester carboxylesterase
MTVSIPILGSRGRELMPGTSIALRAAGFRGEMSRIAGDPANDDMDPLPVSLAAAGADVMLASRLELQIEAVPHDDARLRTRSAALTQPQLIVPRRPSIAYALLQTDAEGRSEFVLPLPGAAEEAIFPLGIPAGGAAHRALRLLVWPGNPVLDAGALESTAQWERFRRPNYITRIGSGGRRSMPVWDELDDGPVLLLLHGTFGTPESAFGAWFEDPSFGRLVARYEGRVLAFAHPTLSASITDNMTWLLAQLPTRSQPVDIVGHGRGGLLARALVADKHLPVRRVIQVGTPNNGTPLAREPLAWLNAHVAPLASMPSQYSFLTLEGALALMRSVALGAEPGLPGIENVLPDGPPVATVGGPESTVRWYTVGAHYRPEADAQEVGIAEPATDLVVSSEDCHRPGAEVTDSLRIAGESVHHHNYFADRRVRDSLFGWLCG